MREPQLAKFLHHEESKSSNDKPYRDVPVVAALCAIAKAQRPQIEVSGWHLDLLWETTIFYVLF